METCSIPTRIIYKLNSNALSVPMPDLDFEHYPVQSLYGTFKFVRKHILDLEVYFRAGGILRCL